MLQPVYDTLKITVSCVGVQEVRELAVVAFVGTIMRQEVWDGSRAQAKYV